MVKLNEPSRSEMEARRGWALEAGSKVREVEDRQRAAEEAKRRAEDEERRARTRRIRAPPGRGRGVARPRQSRRRAEEEWPPSRTAPGASNGATTRKRSSRSDRRRRAGAPPGHARSGASGQADQGAEEDRRRGKLTLNRAVRTRTRGLVPAVVDAPPPGENSSARCTMSRARKHARSDLARDHHHPGTCATHVRTCGRSGQVLHEAGPDPGRATSSTLTPPSWPPPNSATPCRARRRVRRRGSYLFNIADDAEDPADRVRRS